jgi:polyhydroxyalkanoate synthesis regulator phasin
MAQNDIIKRYLDAGMAFTQLSRERAEEFVKDLVKAGEVRRKEAEETVEALVERSRRNTEELVAVIRREVADQLRSLGLEDLVKRAGLPGTAGDKVEEAAAAVDDAAAKASETVAPKKAGAKKAAVKKAPPVSTSGLVVPGAAKKAPAKKLVVPTGVANPAPAQKAAKKATKSAKKS